MFIYIYVCMYIYIYIYIYTYIYIYIYVYIYAPLINVEATNEKALEMIDKEILLQHRKNQIQRLKNKFASRD